MSIKKLKKYQVPTYIVSKFFTIHKNFNYLEFKLPISKNLIKTNILKIGGTIQTQLKARFGGTLETNDIKILKFSNNNESFKVIKIILRHNLYTH